ncbi:Down syndrome critical region protein 3 [Tetranychus urticae]|uniref:Vacuolar protein sorting-associated protein 26C n=1 Tax=Tetranychus urticae TaxID=32264 RepID=T1KHU9_TETUR|nr:Down syndrome critical region protein 3 [Tetranychus urticae]
MTTNFDIKLKRSNKIFHQGENLTGVISFDCKNESRHEGIALTVEGLVKMQYSSKNVGIIDAFYNSVKPVPLINYSVEIAKGGYLPAGKTDIAFELPLRPKTNKTLYETYHGVFITIQYLLRCEVKRSMLNKDLSKCVEFMIETERKDTEPVTSETRPTSFTITPESLQNVKDKRKVPSFRVKGTLSNTICKLTDPFTGELVIEECEIPIRSIELQLVRVETCGCAEGYARDATEIQNIQIGDGDICRGVPIPIYMIFPRLFSCPTLITSNFKIEFEVNVIVIFEDNHLITENFPIKLVRF